MPFETYTLAEAAKQLKKSEDYVLSLINDGKLQAFKIGSTYKIMKDKLDSFVDTEDSFTSGANPFPQKEEESQPAPVSSYIVCGHEKILDMMCEMLANKGYDRPLARSYMCSYQSLNALYFNEVMVGSAHLIDVDNGDLYNQTYVRYLIPGEDCVLIHVTKRAQGLFVKAGNPKHITGWDDLARPDVTFLNRERGAGVRILIDERLREHGITPAQVKGYENVAQSHLAAASAVARGEADVSLGAQRFAKKVKGVEFILMQNESYELVIRESSLDDPQIQDMLEILRNEDFKKKVAEIEGYFPDDMGKITYIGAHDNSKKKKRKW